MPSKKAHFTIRLQPSVADRVDALAARFGISRSAVLEKCIEKYLFDVETELFLLEDLDQLIADSDNDPMVKLFSEMSMDELLNISEKLLKG